MSWQTQVRFATGPLASFDWLDLSLRVRRKTTIKRTARKKRLVRRFGRLVHASHHLVERVRANLRTNGRSEIPRSIKLPPCRRAFAHATNLQTTHQSR